jgi:hypothetical protein
MSEEQPERYPPIPPQARRDADLMKPILRRLFDDYLQIQRNAAAGSPVSTQDFRSAEGRFNGAVRLLPREAQGDQPMNDYVFAETQKFIRDHPEVGQSLNPFTLNLAFYKQHIDGVAPVENTGLNFQTDTEGELVADLLSKNPGFALGDAHNQNETLQFLTRNMAALRKTGVDTIYYEGGVGQYNDLTSKELRSLADTGKFYDLVLPTAQHTAKHFNIAESDHRHKALVLMVAAAKDHGIEIVDMDKGGPARTAESVVLKQRMASTNFSWTENIKADREAMEASGREPGKFVVFGGMYHFIRTNIATDRVMAGSNGLVDEALGIPLLAFEQANPQRSAAFRRSGNANGPDFYLPGGLDYNDTVSIVGDAGQNGLEKLAAAARMEQDDRETALNAPRTPLNREDPQRRR